MHTFFELDGSFEPSLALPGFGVIEGAGRLRGSAKAAPSW